MIDRNDTTWYQDAIIYQVHVKSFFDANGDGIGDFQGLIEKLDHIQALGASAIWILPFYPSPLRDDGYDISDYREINPVYGTTRDFRRFVRAAHDRGLRVITELVINHTSDQHPWFQRARRAKPGSRYRNYYVWNDTDTRYPDAPIIFFDTEPSNWTWDPVAQAYYWHRFYSHQPDLNFDNPRVVEEVLDIMRHWLEMGVDGLRLDAVPYLVERDGTACENLPETHAVIRRLRKLIDDEYPDRMLIAEANLWPEDVLPFFGDGDECHMVFHFPLMPRMYLALAQEDRYPVTDILRQTPELPDRCQWAIFLRNHDELTLALTTDHERDYLWSIFATDPRMKFNLGIRRRLAPLLGNDRRKIELMTTLLLSMPGTPVLYYGDEIGMGDNIYLGDRDGVRTPMQWSADRNAGFSRCDPARLVLPVVMDAVYGYEAVNVESQGNVSGSLLNWTRRLVAVRRQHSAFGRGKLHFLYPGNRKVLAFLREDENERILCVVNLSGAPQAVEIDLAEFRGHVPVEMLGGTAFPPIQDRPYLITLPGHGFYWFVLSQETALPSWHVAYPSRLPELVTLIYRTTPLSLTTGREGEALLTRVLPQTLNTRRSLTMLDAAALPDRNGRQRFLFVLVSDGEREYSAPFGIEWPATADEEGGLVVHAAARVREANRIGLLVDPTMMSEFALALVAAFARDYETTTGRGTLTFRGLPKFDRDDVDPKTARRLAIDPQQGYVLVDERYQIRVYPTPKRGKHPVAELGRYLTEIAEFPYTLPLLGIVEHTLDGETATLGTMHGFIPNQGNGWQFVLGALQREAEAAGLSIGDGAAPAVEAFSIPLAYLEAMGRRTAGLHAALGMATEDPALVPEPFTASDLEGIRAWSFAALTAARRSPAIADSEEEETRVIGPDLIDRTHRELKRLSEALSAGPALGRKIRIHGDLKLRKFLIVQDDVMIDGLGGDPADSLEERRAKRSPLSDAANLLTSVALVVEQARSGLEQRFGELPEPAHQQLDHWTELAVTRFLDGYFKATPQELLPERDTAGVLLSMLVLGRALALIGRATDIADLRAAASLIRHALNGRLRGFDFSPEGDPQPKAQ